MDYTGTWLAIKSADDYSPPHFLKFQEEKRVYYRIANVTGSPLQLERELYFPQPPLKVEVVNEHRLRYYTQGKKTSFYADDSSVTTDTITTQDYQKLLPTQTTLKDEEIVEYSYRLILGDEKRLIKFNTDLDIPFIQEMNERLGREGSKISLERLHETLFLAFYGDGYRDNLLPIKAVDKNSITVYGLPEEPF